MRITAMTAGDAIQGALTEAEARVGELTLGGSVFLVVFGGAIGVFGGLVYLGVRPWLATARRWVGLVFGALMLAMFGWVIIEGDNPDFPLFGFPALNIATFASIFVLYGVLLAPLFDWVSRVLPVPSLRRRYRFLALPASITPGGLGTIAVTAFSLFITVQLVAAIAFGFGEEGETRIFITVLGL
jgi:hypothetical protein